MSFCTNEECTFGETGACILNNEPEECPYWAREDSAALVDDGSSPSDEPALPPPTEIPRFAPSGTLGVEEARTLMRNEYCQVVGVLGEPDSGKTACLVSLYLLLARKRLDGFSYADSKSLLALDELSRGARKWENGMPDQVTAHTVLSDERSAGFVHLKIVRDCDAVRHHLLVPDLPGEWSTSLIDSNRTDRWQFLRSAEVIWLMVDGTSLVDPGRRLSSIHRTNRLLDRLAGLLSPDIPPVRLVVTRRDLSKPSEDTIDQVRKHGARFGLDLEVNHIASFSQDDQTAAGAGIADLIDGTLTVGCDTDDFWL